MHDDTHSRLCLFICITEVITKDHKFFILSVERFQKKNDLMFLDQLAAACLKASFVVELGVSFLEARKLCQIQYVAESNSKRDQGMPHQIKSKLSEREQRYLP